MAFSMLPSEALLRALPAYGTAQASSLALGLFLAPQSNPHFTLSVFDL